MYKFFLPLILVLCAPNLKAQGRLLLDESAARKNLVQSRPPVAPPGVHASGKVVLLVEIDPQGRVTSAKADSGNSRLREAAVDAVKQWRFKPFTVHTEKVSASTKLTVEFGAGAPSTPPVKAPVSELPATPLPASAPPTAPLPDPAQQQFHTLEAKCRTLVSERAEPARQAAACRAAADQASSLRGESRFLQQRSAYVFAATALMRTDDLQAAVAYGSKAVAAVAEGHDDSSGASAAYTVRGQAKAFAGDLPGADLDLTKAEGFERKTLAAAAGKPAEPDARAAMKNLLLFHAKLLEALKQPEKAATKSAEASKL